ncbi:MAG: helix-turn-helix transcriptional regulator [Clostridium sp.]|uniref:helix-turn-helix domain-containing protein n=1 Tax=Clostridium sp. TaxID=1506 RepID=UPI002914682C|nr:helix-turn-helix transcriptional regulator [Clostridium sp.]MDU7338574.1 helix-turn-helix transcriptional regulator [Clostridium sp.]
MLVDKIKKLCDERGETLASLERELGFGNGTIRRWDVTVPSGDKLTKVADFFSVSIDFLLNREQKEMPVLTKEDERDIKNKIDEIMVMMERQKGLMFDGDPLTPEALDSIRSAMELGMAAAKAKNKKK